MKRRFKPASFFTYMILILLASTFILPLIWMLRSSLMGMKQIFRLPPEWIPNPFVWSNYSDALKRLDFAQCFKNTIIVVGLGVSGTVITSACSAYAWARIDWKGRNLWFALSMSSMMLPGSGVSGLSQRRNVRYAVSAVSGCVVWRRRKQSVPSSPVPHGNPQGVG